MTTYLIQILFGATLLLLTAIILCILFRKAAASLRYRIWTFIMLGVLFLVFAVGAIVLIATISLFAKQEIPDEYKDVAGLIVAKDAPNVRIKGRVLNPDGTPADRAGIHYTTFMVKENLPSFPSDKPSYYPATDGVSSHSDREGNFEFELPLKTIGVIYAYRTADSQTLVSPSTVFWVQKDTDSDFITIRLLEGILVSGTAMFEDGTPAVNETISGIRPLPPLGNWKNQNINNAYQKTFIQEFQTRVQPDGKYELYLPPGDFMVKEFNDRESERAVSVSIEKVKEGEEKKEHRIDFLAVPAPLRENL